MLITSLVVKIFEDSQLFNLIIPNKLNIPKTTVDNPFV